MFHNICIDLKIKQTVSESPVSLTILQNFDGLYQGEVESGLFPNAIAVINEIVVRVQSVEKVY